MYIYIYNVCVHRRVMTHLHAEHVLGLGPLQGGVALLIHTTQETQEEGCSVLVLSQYRYGMNGDTSGDGHGYRDWVSVSVRVPFVNPCV